MVIDPASQACTSAAPTDPGAANACRIPDGPPMNSFELVNPRAAKEAAITPVDAAGAAGV